MEPLRKDGAGLLQEAPRTGLTARICFGIPGFPWDTMNVGLELRGTWLPTRLDPRNPVGWKQSQSLTPVASTAT